MRASAALSAHPGRPLSEKRSSIGPVYASPRPTPRARFCTMRTMRKVLVLNATYEPLKVCPVRRALILVLKDKAEVLEKSGTALRSEHALPRPSRHPPHHLRPRAAPEPLARISRRAVFARERHRCQYCGSPRHLTVDHVGPRSKADRTRGTTSSPRAACNRQRATARAPRRPAAPAAAASARAGCVRAASRGPRARELAAVPEGRFLKITPRGAELTRGPGRSSAGAPRRRQRAAECGPPSRLGPPVPPDAAAAARSQDHAETRPRCRDDSGAGRPLDSSVLAVPGCTAR